MVELDLSLGNEIERAWDLVLRIEDGARLHRLAADLVGEEADNDHIDIGQQGHGAQTIDHGLVGRLLVGGGIAVKEPFDR